MRHGSSGSKTMPRILWDQIPKRSKNIEHDIGVVRHQRFAPLAWCCNTPAMFGDPPQQFIAADSTVRARLLLQGSEKWSRDHDRARPN